MLIGLGLALVQAFGLPAGETAGGPGAQARLTTADPALPAFRVEPAVRFEEAEPPAPSRTTEPEPEPGPEPGPSAQSKAVGVPLRLVVPTLGVDAPVIGISATDGVLVPPGDPQTLGWWSGGAPPGAREGGALITGHTVSTGGGAFDDLETLEPGAEVSVRTAAGVIDYEVTGVTIYRKASLARDAATVFSQSGPGRLVLITCEDWTGEIYLSNAVVFAEPVAG